jgi:glycine/D-amino acid oxidase-like deaminating enzyme
MDADLAIVGGGYTGLWTAIRAKERDPERSVVIVEASTIGWAASGRNGGFVEAIWRWWRSRSGARCGRECCTT